MDRTKISILNFYTRDFILMTLPRFCEELSGVLVNMNLIFFSCSLFLPTIETKWQATRTGIIKFINSIFRDFFFCTRRWPSFSMQMSEIFTHESIFKIPLLGEGVN